MATMVAETTKSDRYSIVDTDAAGMLRARYFDSEGIAGWTIVGPDTDLAALLDRWVKDGEL